MKTYRDNGAIGAFLDEYEKSLTELITIIKTITTDELLKIVDTQTKDEDCRSIETILNHVIRAGYNYAIAIRKSLGETLEYHRQKRILTIPANIQALEAMFQFNEQLFLDYPQIKMEENDPTKKIKSNWGQLYDVEQMYEHAICHILRHRRQIERFILKLR